MILLITFGLVVLAQAYPDAGYRAPAPFATQQSQTFSTFGVSCGSSQIRHVDGTCVTPLINRNIFLYEAPRQHRPFVPPPVVPQPRVDYNFVLVRTPEFLQRQAPVVVPPPQQKTIIYVLNRNAQIESQRLIEMAHVPDEPEVYYVNYDDGDNPTLPGGISLQNALQSAAAQQPQVIGGQSAISGGRSFSGGSSFSGSNSFSGSGSESGTFETSAPLGSYEAPQAKY